MFADQNSISIIPEAQSLTAIRKSSFDNTQLSDK